MSGQPVNGFGYYGKVPARGDFIQANLPPDFITSWNEWLQAVTAVSREQQDERWLELYLTSPIWHFVLPSHVCGESAMVGTLMPSVDQVGRHFYFTIAKAVSSNQPIIYWQEKDWSVQAEEKILKVLDDDTDVVKWAEGLASVDWLSEIKAPSALNNHGQQSQQLVLTSPEPEPLSEVQLLHHQLRRNFDRYCVWWTAGSDHVPETTLVTDGLPLVSQFSAMLDGQWEQWGW